MIQSDLLIFAMASGETSQAYAVAKYFRQKGKKITLVIGSKINKLYLNCGTHRLHYYTIATASEFVQFVRKNKPKNILFCNSKSFKHEKWFINHKPDAFKSMKTFTLDSNWLFDQSSTRFPFIKWVDRHYVCFPQELFELGLKNKGGYFKIAKEIVSKIKPIGLIPSYKKIAPAEINNIRRKLSLQKEDKLIFCYFSGYGAAARSWVLYNLMRAINRIHNHRIKILPVGDLASVNHNILVDPNVVAQAIHNMDHFYKVLSSSDLIFQHQGLATLAQGLAANLPIIANVSIYRGDEYPGLHPAEIKPFQKLGICAMFYKNSRIDGIAKTISKLLYDTDAKKRMKENQSRIMSCGEENLFKEINNEIKIK